MALIHRDTDYALRALSHLAPGEVLVPVTELAKLTGTPPDFLRKIMQKLHAAGVVDSVQGATGGYRLARDPAGISVRDVILAVQGQVVVNECFEDPEVCGRVKTCPFRPYVLALQESLDSWFAKVTLADILEDDGAHRGAADADGQSGAAGNSQGLPQRDSISP